MNRHLTVSQKKMHRKEKIALGALPISLEMIFLG
jgi:hypothetical protein